jgi:hypothetical protein
MACTLTWWQSGLLAMNSESNTVARSELRSFSDRPLLHYFLAIIITSIAANFFFSFRIYECLRSGNNYECTYDLSAPVFSGATPPDLPWVLRTTTLISVYGSLFWILSFVILCAPVYALSHYVGLRCTVHRNVVGIVFWIGAWTLAFLSLPILLFALFGFGPRSALWTVYLFESYWFVIPGLFCGIVYCALAFLHRVKTVES